MVEKHAARYSRVSSQSLDEENVFSKREISAATLSAARGGLTTFDGAEIFISYCCKRKLLAHEVLFRGSVIAAWTSSMDQRSKDVREGGNCSSARQQRASFVAAWDCHRQRNRNPIPAHCEQRNSVQGSQVDDHDKCKRQSGASERLRDPAAEYSLSNLEGRLTGMTLNEWWSDDKTQISQQGPLGSVNKGEHCSGNDRIEVRRQGRPNSANAGELVFGAGGDERKVARNLSAPHGGILEAGVSCNTMKEWWSCLSACMGNRQSLLHTEILSFCKTNEMSPEQTHSRRIAQGFLEFTVLQIWPDAGVHLYGSTATGLALPTSDIDIVVVIKGATQKGPCGRPFPDTGPYVSELYNKLQKMDPDMFHSLTQIPHAKVPILKVVFKSGLACDISFDWQNNRPDQGVQIVRQYLKLYKPLKPLILVLKSFLRKHKLNEVFTGGIGSFCLTIMVVHLLQNVGSEAGAAAQDLGALLVSFFMYYSRMHNYDTDVVSTTKSVSKQALGWVNWSDRERLAVQNPLDPTSDIGSGSYNIHDVRVKFSQARRVLLRHWDEEKLLDRIFKPSITEAN